MGMFPYVSTFVFPCSALFNDPWHIKFHIRLFSNESLVRWSKKIWVWFNLCSDSRKYLCVIWVRQLPRIVSSFHFGQFVSSYLHFFPLFLSSPWCIIFFIYCFTVMGLVCLYFLSLPIDTLKKNCWNGDSIPNWPQNTVSPRSKQICFYEFNFDAMLV